MEAAILSYPTDLPQQPVCQLRSEYRAERVHPGDPCPECGQPTMPESGCWICPSCGESGCG